MEPWVALLASGVPTILAAFLAYRGGVQKELTSARVAEAVRIDAATRAFLDTTMADNARLRVENAEFSKMASHWLSVARAWCDLAHSLHHQRNNDRHLADAIVHEAGLPPIEWSPSSPLPGFDAIVRDFSRTS